MTQKKEINKCLERLNCRIKNINHDSMMKKHKVKIKYKLIEIIKIDISSR